MVTAFADPPPNSAGWHDTDVTVVAQGTDDGSGIDLDSCTTVTLTGEGANQSATVSCTDNSGNSASATLTGINIDKTPPTPVHSGPFTVDEGSSIDLDGTGSTDGLSGVASTAWDIDGDDFDDGDPATFDGIDGPATFDVSLQVIDLAGNQATVVTQVTVDNVAPSVTANDDTIDENGVATVSGDIDDPGSEDSFTVTIDWGEGAPVDYSYPAGSTSYSEDHQYLDDNPSGTSSDTYPISVTVTDDDAGQGSDSTTVVVDNLNPVVNATGSTIDEGQSAGVSATFTDAGIQDTHTATINWGDGESESVTVTQGAGFGSLSASHVYGDNGAYTVTVTVTDDDTGAGSAQATVNVNNLDPALIVDTSGQIVLAGGSVFMGRNEVEQTHSASASDPGSDDLTFDWDFQVSTVSNIYYNDGFAPDPLPSPHGVFPFNAGDTASVTFNAPGIYELTVTATDDDGGSDSSVDTKVVVDNCDCTKSQGFWKKQFKSSVTGKGKQHIDDATLGIYLDIVRFASGIFDEQVALAGIADAHLVFNPAKGNNSNGGNGGTGSSQGTDSGEATNPRDDKKKKKNGGSGSGTGGGSGSGNNDSGNGSESATGGTNLDKSRNKALSQTLAAWLNFAKGAIDWTEMIDTDDDGIPDMAFGDLIGQVESTLGNPDATKADLEQAKDLAEAVNQHDKDNPDCETGSGTGTGSATGSQQDSGSDTGSNTKSDKKNKKNGKKNGKK